MKILLRGGSLLMILLVVVLVVRAAGFESKQMSVEPFAKATFDANAIAQRLSAGLKHKTISHSLEGPIEAQAFLDLHAQLRSDYPLVHQHLSVETVADHSLLYQWKGTKPQLPVALLIAHQDVVPVEAGSETNWEHPPYSGDIDATHVWGRGAMDDKGSLFCIMEAVEGLLAQGYAPERSVVLAFGHDEELGGPKGAQGIAALLAERGIKAHYALDEGGAITVGSISIVDNPVAVIGIAEKGMVSIELDVETLGGHSSMPPRQTGIGILSAAIVALEQNPMPGGISGTVGTMLDYLGPEFGFLPSLVTANRWLFNPLLEMAFASQPTLDAMLRTTTAATIFNGGVKANVLPSRVKATVNFRILPGDLVEDVVEHVTRVVNDERVQISVAPESREPSPISPIDADGFQAIQHSIHGFFPDAIVTPYLVLGGTDARYYSGITENLYRFSPFLFTNEDRERIHGTNERIGIDTLPRAVGFYSELIKRTTGDVAL
jgi:carboxypeptidase PM20D1